MNWIFTGGYMHSGTTLLKKVLTLKDDVYEIEGESKFFEQLPVLQTWVQREDAPQLTNYFSRLVHLDSSEVEAMVKKFLNQQNSFDKGVFTLFKFIVEEAASSEGKSIVLEKTPSNVFYIDIINREFKDSSFVGIVRDVRQVVLSKKLRVQSTNIDRYDAETLKVKKFEKDYSFGLDAISWKRWVAIMRSHKAYYVRYEDLVEKPESTIREICKELNWEYTDNMTQVKGANTAASNKQNVTGIQKMTTDWSEKLKAREVSFLQDLCRSELKQLEYRFLKVNVLSKVLGKLLYLQIIPDVIVRVYKRYKLLGFDGFILMGKNYIKRFK